MAHSGAAPDSDGPRQGGWRNFASTAFHKAHNCSSYLGVSESPDTPSSRQAGAGVADANPGHVTSELA